MIRYRQADQKETKNPNLKLKIVYIIFICTLLISCDRKHAEEIIIEKYKSIIEKDFPKAKIINVRILDSHEITFERLANSEFDRMLNQNIAIKKLLEIQFSIDSLINSNIEHRNCFYKNANKEYQLKYNDENRKDSIQLEKGTEIRLKNKLKHLENKLRILEIKAIIKNDSTFLEESKWIRHEVEIIMNDIVIKDTLNYMEFGNVKYSYLSKNVFLENE